MGSITKIILSNYKKFQHLELDFNPNINILIGENESGKSTILEAISLVFNANYSKIEYMGLENLINKDVQTTFLESDKSIKNLPKMLIEVYLSECNDPKFSGENNSKKIECDGVSLLCEYDENYEAEIENIVQESNIIPFEYYKVTFTTFQGANYKKFSKHTKTIFIDNSKVGTSSAYKDFTSSIYNIALESPQERYSHEFNYRKMKSNFVQESFQDINTRMSLDSINFTVRSSYQSNLSSDITIQENLIPLEQHGRGKQAVIKTKLALKKVSEGMCSVLIEEPETSLSHINMNTLIRMISETTNTQIILSTHCDLICSRLNLQNAILMSDSKAKTFLDCVTNETANFFKKSTNTNLLQFVLAPKVILVEGNAEYILLEDMYKKITSKFPYEDNVHVIAVNGTAYKRYLEVAKSLNIKVANVIDNDGDIENKCKLPESELKSDIVHFFYSTNENLTTLEMHLYECNTSLCEELFSEKVRTRNVQEYMIAKENKTDVALILLEHIESLTIPNYICEAIEWIKD